MPVQEFFDYASPQSKAKIDIASGYFYAWANVMMSKSSAKRLGYIDLFSGPGCYRKDGTKSTPIRVLEYAAQHEKLREMLVSIFNDLDALCCAELQRNISKIPNIGDLKHAPQIESIDVGEKLVTIIKAFSDRRLIPTFMFLDPWGYKGMTMELIGSVLKDWGCDCLFFFNYRRIIMGLFNPYFTEHIDAIFGEDRAESLRNNYRRTRNPSQKAALIEDALAGACEEIGGRYMLTFGFRGNQGRFTQQWLVFVSKGYRGYDIMKGIMASKSSVFEQGVPLYYFDPQVVGSIDKEPLLGPLDDLVADLPKRFEGQTMTVREVYDDDNVGTPFVAKNYKDALRKLEEAGRITASRPPDQRVRRKGVVTMPDELEITFQ